MVNILLIICDSVRASNVGIYDHSANTTPNIDNFAQNATIYNHAYSPGIWSLPSHASMFTGLEVAEHQLTSRADSLEYGHSIWDKLNKKGYETAVFSRNPFITTDSYGLSSGFNSVIRDAPTYKFPYKCAANPTQNAEEEHVLENFRRCLHDQQPIRSILNSAIWKVHLDWPTLLPHRLQPVRANGANWYAQQFLDWHESQKDPWAACVNFVDAHDPYLPEQKHDIWGKEKLRRVYNKIDDHRWDYYSNRRPWWEREAFEALYDGCIHQIDNAVGKIVSTLRDRDALGKTLVVITSDHGEGFGERSRVRPDFRVVGHNGGIHESIVNVPLLVQSPEQQSKEEITTPVSLTQFFDVVSECLQGNYYSDAFVCDAPVVSLTNHDRRYKYEMQSMGDYIDEIDMSIFSGTAMAKFSKTGRFVEKSVAWGSDTANIEILNAQQSMKTDNSNPNEVKQIFSRFTPANIKRDDRSVDSIDDTTLDRLRNLGYA